MVPANCILVATHIWDFAGAQLAGLRSSFIAREEQNIFSPAELPEIVVLHLAALARTFGASAASPPQDPGSESSAKRSRERDA